MRRLLVLLTLSVCACTKERDPRPSVLLISLDSVRRDLVGAYGDTKLPYANGRSPSPNLDRLAAEGVLVDAVSTTSWTLPAHVTLFTGLPELVHGVEQDGQRIDDALPTLPEILRDAGYRTAGVYSGPYLDPRFGFGRGFERYLAGYGPELSAAALRAAAAVERVRALDAEVSRDERYEALTENAWAERALEVASHQDSSSQTVSDLLLAELAEAADDERRPFFLFAHYFDPHFDYVPPPPFDRLFDPDYSGAVDGRDFARRLAAPELDARDLEHLRALQAGELAWTDAQIGRVLDELDRRGLAGNTLVVVVSDHGEEFLEHGGLGHRRTLHEESVRVPMILRLPGVVPAGREHGPTSLAAVKPTVLALVEGERPLWQGTLESPAGKGLLGRLIVNPTGERQGVRVIESFHHQALKLLRERALTAAETTDPDETLRWIDLQLHPDERDADWTVDFMDSSAREALEAFRHAYDELTRMRRAPATTEKTDDLLAAFRGLGYAGEEARLGAIASDEIVLPRPGDSVLGPPTGR